MVVDRGGYSSSVESRGAASQTTAREKTERSHESRVGAPRFGRTFPSHGRGRRFNLYSAHHSTQVRFAARKVDLLPAPAVAIHLWGRRGRGVIRIRPQTELEICPLC